MGYVDLAVMLIELRQVPLNRPSLEGVVRSKKRVCKEEMSDEFEHYPIPCSKDRFRHCKDDY